MPCYHPLKGYRSKTVNASGKRSIVFDLREGYIDLPVELPCGRCIGCRLERSRQWAIRCMHEAQLYEDNCFLTLTYSDENLPSHGSLTLSHFQNFMKKLRKHSNQKIRFYHCGEYGEKYHRPHYHACVFNYDFKDKKLWKKSLENPLYISETLTKLWGHGHAVIGNVTFDSAAYVARYITKKELGKKAWAYYCEVDPQTGEITKEISPEYTTMSRRPGIGKGWFEKFHTDVYPEDFVVIKEQKFKPPKYYDSQFELAYPSDYDSIKGARRKEGKKHAHDNTHERLLVKEEIKNEKFKLLKRGYENGSENF